MSHHHVQRAAESRDSLSSSLLQCETLGTASRAFIELTSVNPGGFYYLTECVEAE